MYRGTGSKLAGAGTGATILDLEPVVIRGQVINAREGRAVPLFNRGGAEKVGLQEELREIRTDLKAGEIPAEEVAGIDTLIVLRSA